MRLHNKSNADISAEQYEMLNKVSREIEELFGRTVFGIYINPDMEVEDQKKIFNIAFVFNRDEKKAEYE